MTTCTNLVETHPRHIPTRFEVNLADGYGEQVKISQVKQVHGNAPSKVQRATHGSLVTQPVGFVWESFVWKGKVSGNT